MLRRVLIISAVVALQGCDGISLEGDAARPWACIPTYADGGGVDAGKQCSDGWSCGFDEKCFIRDGGQAAQSWRCVVDDQCPIDWRCGAEVNDQRLCQRLDAGAPSPCNVESDCQGGWRCGLDLSLCFDPSVSDVDAGRSRHCQADAGNQCPNGFRCGEGVPVGGVALCLLLDAGTDAPCLTDDGCEGGWRCDLHASQCVKVTDVVDPGPVTTFSGVVISPLVTRPAPDLVSVTRLTSIPSALLDFDTTRPPPLSRPGLLYAASTDAGVWVVAQSTDRERFSDGGRQDAIQTRFFPATRGGLDELVVGELGILTRYSNDALYLRRFDGSEVNLGSARGIRGVDLGDRLFSRYFFTLGDRTVHVVTLDGGLDGGFDFPPFPPPPPPPPDGGMMMPPPDGGARVLEVLGLGTSEMNARFFAWGDDDSIYAWPEDDGGQVWSVKASSKRFARARAASAVNIDNVRPGGVLEVIGLDGGVNLSPFLPAGQGTGIIADDVQTFPPCPAGTSLIQASFDRPQNNPGAVVRCAVPDGGVISAFSRFNFTGNMPRSGQPIFMQVFEQVSADDLLPYQGTVVNARGAASVRAHAGANGRFWVANDFDAGALPGSLQVRPLVLDRAPDSIVVVPALGRGVVSSAAGIQFELDDELGLTSLFRDGDFSVLDTFRNAPDWIVTPGGAVDLTTVTTGQPRAFLVLANPMAQLTNPVSAFRANLVLGGAQRQVVLLSSGDALWAADITDALGDPFAAPAQLAPVFIPMPGVRLRSLALVDTDGGVGGFITTNTSVIEFSTDDLVQWKTSTVAAPQSAALPLEVWNERGQGRVGTRNGEVWSVPIMVPLTGPLPATTGVPLTVDDFARRCGAVFATTRQGVFALQPATSGRPQWVSLDAVNAQLETLSSLRLYETSNGGDRLFVATPRGQVVEISAGPCP